MAYRIDLTRRIAEELPRLAIEELRGAAADLRDPASNRATAIHEARKKLKKSRAVLRLVRPHLGERFAVENQRIRDAAGRLSGARDADVLVLTSRELGGHAPGIGLEELERRLVARASSLHDSERAPDLDAIVERIQAAARAVESWPPLPDDFSTIRPGLTRIYRCGRRARDAAAASPASAAMHEWRKRAKDLWYATRLLRDVDPVVVAQESNLDVLCERLGRRHDLDVLQQTLEAEPALLESLSGRDIAEAAGVRRRDLDEEAFLLGGVVWSWRTGRFTALLEERWRAAPRALVRT